MEVIAIIPSRLNSSRFPNKPLVKINGKTLIENVYTRVSQVFKTYIAVDSHELYRKCKKFSYPIITGEAICGTDRCYNAIKDFKPEPDYVVNVQGDLPFIEQEHLELIKNNLSQNHITTIAVKKEGLTDKNNVKVTVDKNGFALYFSRSRIPFGSDTYLKHIGIYAYPFHILSAVANIPESEYEKSESLEQLRWLEYGYKIKVIETTVDTISIDTPDDLNRKI
jgi:3-deoxy-manno-octulosonate cytidylyltransferase (CMP-KDO synthetase)